MKVHYPLLLTVMGGTAWWTWQATVPTPNQPTVTQKPAVPATLDEPSATARQQFTKDFSIN